MTGKGRNLLTPSIMWGGKHLKEEKRLPSGERYVKGMILAQPGKSLENRYERNGYSYIYSSKKSAGPMRGRGKKEAERASQKKDSGQRKRQGGRGGAKKYSLPGGGHGKSSRKKKDGG